MKKNILYLAGALLSSAILMFGCSEDIPTYSELTVDKTEVFIQADGENPTAIVNITEGNDNYKISVADENIASATLDDTRIIINGLRNGITTATVMDWTKHSTVITIKVKEDFELKLDKTELLMFLGENDNELVNIVSGNGGYQVESSDDNVAIAELNHEGKLSITAQAGGFCDITVIDADGNKAIIKIKVCKEHIALEDIADKVWLVGETSSIAITSGNGEYTVISEKPEIASAEIVNDAVSITGTAKGETGMTVTDKMGLTTSITIKVTTGFEIATTHIDNLWIGEEAQEIAIVDGSGNYTIESSSSITCILSEDKSKLIVKGVEKEMALNQTIKVTDEALKKTIEITVSEVNYRFEEYGTARWYINGSFGQPKNSEFTTSDGKDFLKVGEKKYSFSKMSNGFSMSFKGGREPGLKTEPVLWHLNSSGKEVDQINITDLEIVKRELDEGRGEEGKYWIRFHEEGKEGWSYIITWT